MFYSISTLFSAKWASDTGQEVMDWAPTYNGQDKEHMQDLVVTVVEKRVKMVLRQIHLGNGIFFL